MVRAVVLGIAQDGGVPHIGCRQPLCLAARRDPSRRQRVACLAHPLVGETMALLSAPALRGRVHFIHLNHTNRLLWDADAVRSAQARGFRVARDGDAFPL